MSERIAFAVVVVAAVVAALPVMIGPYPVAQDLPAHIETAAQLLALWRGDAIAISLVAHAPPWPNSLPTAALAGLLSMVGDDVSGGLFAGRFLYGAGTAAWPISLALLARRLGRSPLLALIALPTAFDLSFTYGFLHFVVGKPVWALTLWCALDAARATRRLTVIALPIMLVVLFHTHLLLFVTALPLCALAIVTGEVRRVRALVSLAGGAVPGLWWMAAHPQKPGASTYVPLREAVAHLWENLGDLAVGHHDVIPWALAGIALAVAIGARSATAPRRDTVFLVVAGVALLAMSMLGPIRTPAASIVAERFSSLAVALLVLAAPIRAFANRAALVICTLGVVAAVVVAFDLTTRFSRFAADDLGDLVHLLDDVPRGAVVFTHFAEPRSVHGRHNARWHWSKLVALRGAVTDDTFALRDTCVVGLKPGASWPKHPPLHRVPWTAELLSHGSHVLVVGDEPRADDAARAGVITLVHRSGAFSLWRIGLARGSP